MTDNTEYKNPWEPRHIIIEGIGQCWYTPMFGMDANFDKDGNQVGYRTGYWDKKRVWIEGESVEFKELS